MSEQYKGYELNTAGDKNWADREETLHKAQIDADVALALRETNLESFDASIKNTIQSGYTRKFKANAGELHNLLDSYPVNAEYRVTVRPYITKHLVKAYFCDGDVLDNKWVFEPTITTQYTYVNGERVLDIIIPAGFIGALAHYPIGELAYNTNNPYRLKERIGAPISSELNTGFQLGVYTFTQDYFRTYYQAMGGAGGMYMSTFSQPFNVYEEERGGENFEYRITVDTAPATDIHLYLSFIEVSDDVDPGTYDIGSLYMGTGELVAGVSNFTEKAKTGYYLTNAPLIDNGNITTVADAEVEVIITYESFY